jgi:O-antigen/teichoic acid export membrane protein
VDNWQYCRGKSKICYLLSIVHRHLSIMYSFTFLSFMNLVIKDAAWQIMGRVASAIGGFLVIKMITPYLGPLRFGDYSTILKFFAIWSAFADFGLYVIGLKMLGKMKATSDELVATDTKKLEAGSSQSQSTPVAELYGKIVGTRLFMICLVYTLAIIVAYLIPAYTSNPYLVRWLPIGMLFSASFMTAGILQTPLQLFRKMEQVSIGLILARVSQIAVLAGVIYLGRTEVDFSGNTATTPFVRILWSVLISWIVQTLYVVSKSKKHLPLRPRRDRAFTKSFLFDNWQYGIAYYLSSFHTLVVLILLSIFYPTIEGYTFAGTRALGLSLIEILLIVPSSLGNSLIHSTSHAALPEQKSKFGALGMLVVWIGCLVTVLFLLFGTPLIGFLGGSKYLGTATERWADTILPYLGIVITLSFAKQVFNYLFVSTGNHNKLLWTNLFGVVVGLAIGIPALLHRQLLWGVITQLVLEAAFLWGAIWIAGKQNLLPTVRSWKILLLVMIVVAVWFLQPYISMFISASFWWWFVQWIVVTVLLTLVSLPWLKQRMRMLK